MARLSYAPIAFALALPLALTACSSKNTSNNPDAPVVITTDAPPPDAGIPDALVCTAPQKDCGSGACVDTSSDENNCGDCGMMCTQGGSACLSSQCACPTGDFLPASIDGNALLSMDVSNFHILIDAAAVSANAQNAFVIAVATTGKTTGAFTLQPPSGGGLPTPPIVAIGYNANLAGQSVDAYYVAVSGTLTISKFTCTSKAAGDPADGSEIKGALANVKFQGATGTFPNFTVDPNGCVYSLTAADIDIVGTTACTP
jgi:hypothetical protein